MLTVWGRKTSSNVQALMWCIGELGLAYERHDVGHRHGGNDTPSFLAMNPNGTVPVLRDGDGVPIWETGAIMRYLASRYGSDWFWPEAAASRAQIDQWAEWAKINITLKFTVPIFWPMTRVPLTARDPAGLARPIAALGGELAVAEAVLSRQDYLAGPDFSLADVQFGHVLYRYFDIPIARPILPALDRYYARLVTRPAFRTHVMISYAELVAG